MARKIARNRTSKVYEPEQFLPDGEEESEGPKQHVRLPGFPWLELPADFTGELVDVYCKAMNLRTTKPTKFQRGRGPVPKHLRASAYRLDKNGKPEPLVEPAPAFHA
jgi:hypothetical protein